MVTKKLLEKIESESHEEAVFDVLKELCMHFSIENVALAIFAKEAYGGKSFFVYENYPKNWGQHYLKNNFFAHDPIFNALREVALPFEWNVEKFQNVTDMQKRLLSESKDFGINFGVTVPLIPYRTFHGFVTVLNQSSLHYDILHSLSVIGNVSANKIMTLKRTNKQSQE